jgi:hypothetical protein
MATRKRKLDLPSLDGDDTDPPRIRNVTVGVESLPHNKYGVAYTVTFTKPCCSFHKKAQQVRIWVKSEVEFFDDPAIPYILMMDKTIKFIRRHKKEKLFDGIERCQLDYGDGIGAWYMKHDESDVGSIWRLLWASAENEINKIRLLSYECSEHQANQHKSKVDTVLKKDWVEGSDFQNPMAKSRAIKRVKDALFLATKKSNVKATIVLSDLVSNLTRSPHFDKNYILTEERRRKYAANKGEWIDKLNPNSKLATDTWLERVEWRDYEYKTKPTLATHTQEIAHQASLH